MEWEYPSLGNKIFKNFKGSSSQLYINLVLIVTLTKRCFGQHLV